MNAFPIYISYDSGSNNNGGYRNTFWCSMSRISFLSLEALWAYRAALVVYLLHLTGIFGSNYLFENFSDRRCECCENCNHVIPAAEDYDTDEYAEDGDDEDDDDDDDSLDDDDDDDDSLDDDDDDDGDMEVDDHVHYEDVIDLDSDGEAEFQTGPNYQSAPAPAPAPADDPMEEEKSDVDLELRLWFTK